MNDPPDDVTRRDVFVALGSNLGDRIAHLRFGVDALRDEPEVELLDVSPVYESPAHTLSREDRYPDFLNAVVHLATTLEAEPFLDALHRIERAAGRRREADPPWAPRTLDLDLLIFGREVIRNERLTVPHPGIGRRRFVLLPLADLDPDRYVPDPHDKSVGELLAECPDTDRPAKTTFSL